MPINERRWQGYYVGELGETFDDIKIYGLAVSFQKIDCHRFPLHEKI